MSSTAQQHKIPLIVGQIVHYWPMQCEKSHEHDQPFRADICHINDDGTVNLTITNEHGITSRRHSVPFVQGQDPKSGEVSIPRRKAHVEKVTVEEWANRLNEAAAPRLQELYGPRWQD